MLDNLKEGVVKPDIYDGVESAVRRAARALRVVADPCRVRDPNRKGTVETPSSTPEHGLKVRRFESIEAQNAFLAHWEDAGRRCASWAQEAPVMEMYGGKAASAPAAAGSFRYFKQGRAPWMTRAWWRWSSYYRAAPPPYSKVTVRIYAREIEILDAAGGVLRRHQKSARKGKFQLLEEDRLFNPRARPYVSSPGWRRSAEHRAVCPRAVRPTRPPRPASPHGLPIFPTLRPRRHRRGVRKLLEAQCVS